MTSNNQKNIPSGLYVLSGFLLLSILGNLYYAVTVPSYIYLAIILIPLFIYMGIGIFKRWPGVRQTVMKEPIMKLKTQHHWGILVFAAFIVCSCSSDNTSQIVDQVKPEVLPKPHLFIDFEQNGMVQPSSVEMLGKSQIAVLDNKLNEVLVFSDRGELELRFGGKGKGPGEFSRPRYIYKSPASINVIDAELYRVNQLKGKQGQIVLD